MNKKAAEKIFSIWWIFVLGVILAGIVIGVLIFYNSDINIKNLEADVLSERIYRCLTEGIYLKQEILNADFNIFSNCRLKEELFLKDSNFYFKISIYNSSENLIKELSGGDASFEKDCEIENSIRARHYPVCVKKEESIYFLQDNGKIIIIAGSNQEIKKEANL